MENNKLGQEPAFAAISNGQDVCTTQQGMSKRFYAAIELGVPDSGEEWLDKMIIKSNRVKAARAAMQGLFTAGEYNNSNKGYIIERSYQYADELLKQENL